MNLSTSQVESSSCQCTMTLYGYFSSKKKNLCNANSMTVAGYAKRFSHGHSVVSRAWMRKGTVRESNTYQPNGDWEDVAEHMLLHFSESGPPVFRGTSALHRGTLKSKGGGKLSIHFCGDPQTVEVIFRTVISVNQLSAYGAVADMCEEVASRISNCSASMERPVAKDKLETMVAPTDLSSTTNRLLTNAQARRNLLRDYKQRFADLPDDLRMIKLCSDAGFHEDC